MDTFVRLLIKFKLLTNENVFTCKAIHGKISVVNITKGNTFEHKAIKNHVL